MEEQKKQLGLKIGEVADLCEEIMSHEGHVGALVISIKSLIALLYIAEGRVNKMTDLSQEEFVYPLPPLKEVEVKVDVHETLPETDSIPE